MANLGFYFNESACIGCFACQISCKDRHDLPVGVTYRRVKTYQTGTYPNARMFHFTGACNHCADPACVNNCPTGAMYVDEDGTVQHDDEACIGCRTCAAVCPYDAPQYREELQKVGKCDACKPFRDHGQNPVCVDACPMRALEFGDLDELRSRHEGKELVSDLPILPSSDTTQPSLLVTPRAAAKESSFSEVLL